MPIAEKRLIVQMAAEDLTFAFQYQAGYFPEYLVFTFKIVQSIIYLIIQWKLISDFKKSNENIQIQTQILKVVKFIFFFRPANCFNK